MIGPRDFLAAVGRGGSAAAIVEHLAEHGPASTTEVSDATAITVARARAELRAMRAGGLVEHEADCVRVMFGPARHRYVLKPEALRAAARWLDVLADRADRANGPADYRSVQARGKR